MVNLLSHHDPIHIHAILGALALFHFGVRLVSMLIPGSSVSTLAPVAAIGRTPAWLWVTLHGLLSWSSLLLPVPAKRRTYSPQIWPEFRLHSILFASRHVVCTLLSFFDLWPKQMILGVCARVGMVCSVNALASLITKRLGSSDSRTTNSMAYPDDTDQLAVASMKRFYASAQLFATLLAVNGQYPLLVFFPLLGIQGAAFLMTLVRKGKIGTRTYHRLYTATLLATLIAGFSICFHGTDLADWNPASPPSPARILSGVLLPFQIALWLRLKRGASPYVVWPFTLCLAALLQEATHMIAPEVQTMIAKFMFAGFMFAGAHRASKV